VAANNLDSLISDWKSSVVKDIISSDDTDRLAEHALHLARVLAYPGLDIAGTLAMIDSMGAEIEQILTNTDDYYNPLNSYLNVVIERKTGIPITLAILYLRVAHAVNFRMYPVGFPAHFLVKHVLEDNSGEIIVDPFNGGRIMDDYSLKALLDQTYPRQNIPLTHALVEKATSAQVMTRMLNNLKGSYYEAQDMDRYLIANEMVLAIDQYNPDAIRDKGVLLLKSGDSQQALAVLNMYLEINPEAEDADEILDIIRQIRSGAR
jgi:regulator of sirC expression with transglutaminase-like and TPR domain